MKKLILSLVFLFSIALFLSANTRIETPIFDTIVNESTIDNPENEYPDCWAAADQAEISTCGYVGCNFQLWEDVYNACQSGNTTGNN